MRSGEPTRTKEQVFYTVAEIASRWQCSEKNVRRFIARKELIVHRLGHQIRISLADLLSFERQRRVG